MKRIDDALRRLHDEVLAMPVPDRFEAVLRRLREREAELGRPGGLPAGPEGLRGRREAGPMTDRLDGDCPLCGLTPAPALAPPSGRDGRRRVPAPSPRRARKLDPVSATAWVGGLAGCAGFWTALGVLFQVFAR